MNWKEYKNELIIILTFIVMIYGYSYKQNQESLQKESSHSIKLAISELEEVIAIKKIWTNDKNIERKITRLKSTVSSSKFRWRKQRKKMLVEYRALNSIELNRVIKKILNIPVEIEQFNIKKIGLLYNLEFKCKW